MPTKDTTTELPEVKEVTPAIDRLSTTSEGSEGETSYQFPTTDQNSF